MVSGTFPFTFSTGVLGEASLVVVGDDESLPFEQEAKNAIIATIK
jgi:hypothetical protein